jgi:hypothetical protein
MVWEWTKEHGIDHAEHRSVCPDAQGERDYCDGCEAGMLQQTSDSMANVLK